MRVIDQLVSEFLCDVRDRALGGSEPPKRAVVVNLGCGRSVLSLPDQICFVRTPFGRRICECDKFVLAERSVCVTGNG